MIVIVSDNWDQINAVLAALGVGSNDAVVTTAEALKDRKKVAKPARKVTEGVSRADLVRFITDGPPVRFDDIADNYPPEHRGRIKSLLATMREYFEGSGADEVPVYRDDHGFWKLKDHP